MPRILSMRAAIIAALVMLAVFDSAARSDKQYGSSRYAKLSGGLDQQLVAQEVARRPPNVLTATSRRAAMPFVTEVILRSDTDPLVEGR